MVGVVRVEVCRCCGHTPFHNTSGEEIQIDSMERRAKERKEGEGEEKKR